MVITFAIDVAIVNNDTADIRVRVVVKRPRCASLSARAM